MATSLGSSLIYPHMSVPSVGAVLGLLLGLGLWQRPTEVALDQHGDAREVVLEVLPDALALIGLEALPERQQVPSPIMALVAAEAGDRLVLDVRLHLLAGAGDLVVVVLEVAGVLDRLLIGDAVLDSVAVYAGHKST